MVNIACNGRILSEVQLTQTRAGVPRSEFVIECESPDSLALRFTVACLGKTAADSASALQRGAKILVFGRMASASGKGGEKRILILASLFEVLASDATENVYDFADETETEQTK